MRGWSPWYRNLVVAWLLLGVPSMVIGYGMAGGDFELPDPADVIGLTLWLLIVGFYLSPFLLWPVRRREWSAE